MCVPKSRTLSYISITQTSKSDHQYRYYTTIQSADPIQIWAIVLIKFSLLVQDPIQEHSWHVVVMCLCSLPNWDSSMAFSPILKEYMSTFIKLLPYTHTQIMLSWHKYYRKGAVFFSYVISGAQSITPSHLQVC